MSPPRQDRTMMVSAPTFHRSGKAWRDFKFANLEKVSKSQMLLTRRLEWLLPGITATGHASESVRARLKELFEEEARMVVDYVHVIPPKMLRKWVGDPTFLAVLAPMPNKTRGFLEIELALAHAAIDMLLGGAGEAVSLRPLTDIEEGVISYVIIETLKALAPVIDPGLPKLRLEGIAHGVEEAISLLGDEQQLAVVQMKCVLAQHSGYIRVFVPASVLSLVNPPPEGEARRTKRAAETKAHLRRLMGVKTWMRAEIGWAEIGSSDLAQLRERDVMLVDQITARPDKGEGGTCKLKVGTGRSGHVDGEVAIENGRYQAKITGFTIGESARNVSDAEAPDGAAPAGGASEAVDGPAEIAEESTNPSHEVRRGSVDESTLKSQDGSDLLNDIPLQIAVELARVPVTAEEVVSLKVGQVIDLNRVPGEPVELSVNGKIVARGELVEVEGHLGVRVLSLTG